MKNLVVSALLASAIAAPACAAELVTNGGFEDPAGLNAGWNHSISSSLDIVFAPGGAFAGDNLLRFSAKDGGAADTIYRTLNTVVGATYTYSFAVYSDTSLAGASSDFTAMLGSNVLVDFKNSDPFAWGLVIGSYVATSTKTELSFSGFSSKGAYGLDNVSVTGPTVEIDLPGTGGGAVPEPATWAMMLLGFGVVGATMRRRRAAGLAFAA